MPSQLSAPALHILAITAEQWQLSGSKAPRVGSLLFRALLLSLLVGALQTVRLTWINRNGRTRP